MSTVFITKPPMVSEKYWKISRPLKYAHKKSTRHAACLLVCAGWTKQLDIDLRLRGCVRRQETSSGRRSSWTNGRGTRPAQQRWNQNKPPRPGRCSSDSRRPIGERLASWRAVGLPSRDRHLRATSRDCNNTSGSGLTPQRQNTAATATWAGPWRFEFSSCLWFSVTQMAYWRAPYAWTLSEICHFTRWPSFNLKQESPSVLMCAHCRSI